MADQRPAFRFRLPWQSAAPPPRPALPRRPSSQPAATPTPTTPQTAATPAPTQPTITTAPTTPTAPQTAATQAPSRPTITTTPTTPTAPQIAATQAPSQPTITTTPAALQRATTPTPTQPTMTTAPTTPTAPQTTATQVPSQPTITTNPTTPTAPQTAATQAPSQPTITTTPTPTTPQTAETQVPTQPSSITTPAPTQTAERVAITQPTITTSISPTTVPQRAETQIPTQPPPATTIPIPTTERPPFRPPGVAQAQAPLPQSQTSRTESQPSSPSRVTTQPRVPSQPASPSRAATQSRASSQSSTPPRAVPQPRAVSLPSSPSRRSPQLPSTPRTSTQPRSTTILASRPAGQTLPSPSPSSTTAQPQPSTETVNQPTSPLKKEQSQTRDSSQPSVNSAEVISPLTDKQELKSAISEKPSLELQPKPATISGIAYDSQDRAPNETSIQPTQMIRGQPSKESEIGAAKVLSTVEGQETPVETQISHNATNNGKPELFPKEFEPEETKDVKEVVQENKGKAHDEARHKEADLTGELGQTMQTKDLPNIAFRSEQTQKHIDRKEITATSASNGKQTKITTTQPRNKTMVVDTHQTLDTSNGEHIPLHKEVRDDISKLVNMMAAGESKHSIADDRPVSIITLAGENRGASMQVGSDPSRKEAVHIRRGYEIKPDDSAEATTDGEESFKEKSNNPKNKEDQASEEYVNSNVQGINNSIMFNSSITEKNPGVHLIHSHFATEPKKPSEKPGLSETKKAEFNMTPSQKLTYEPTVRRRCLRGLFLESSDSDMDGTKSQHHGCRVGCNKKSEENKVDIL